MRLDADRFAAVVASTIKSALSGIVERVTALEQRQVTHGKDGAPGPQGPEGQKGIDGASGRDGQDGEPGPAGPVGPAGQKGVDGTPGRDGRDGQPGIQGEKGLDGKDGRDGVHGKDGADGLNGKDAVGFDDIQVEHDGERGFTFKFIRGEQVKTFGTFTVPAMIHRGIWKSGEDYTLQDVTTRDGSQWVCIDPLKKGTPGAGSPDQTGWLLVVKRGDVGKPGPKGGDGPQGKQGPQGPQGRNGY